MASRRSSEPDLEVLEPEVGEGNGDPPAAPPAAAPAPKRGPSRLLVGALVVALVAAATATGIALELRSELADARRGLAPTESEGSSPSLAASPLFTYGSGFAIGDARALRHGSLAVVAVDRLQVLDAQHAEVRYLGGEGSQQDPQWSTSGRWLSYVEAAEGGRSVRVVHSDGTGRREVGILEYSARGRRGVPSWSPTDDRLAFVTDAGVLVATPEGGPAVVTPGSGGATSVVWAPDGRRIAFTASSSAGDALVVAAVDGGAPHTVVNDPKSLGSLAVAGWSPDGDALLYWRGSGSEATPDSARLMTVPANGGQPTYLTTMLPHRPWLSWSPDGRRVVVVSGGNRRAFTDKQLSVCDGSAGKCRVIAGGRGTVALDPAWSPDGSQIVYVRADDAEFTPYDDWVKTRRLWTVRPDGKGADFVGAGILGAGTPAWARDGKSLLVVGIDGIWVVQGGQPARQVASRDTGRFPPGYDDGFVDWGRTVAWRPG